MAQPPALKTRILFEEDAPFAENHVDVEKSYNMTKRNYEDLTPHIEIKNSKGLKQIIKKTHIASIEELPNEPEPVKEKGK